MYFDRCYYTPRKKYKKNLSLAIDASTRGGVRKAKVWGIMKGHVKISVKKNEGILYMTELQFTGDDVLEFSYLPELYLN